MLSRLFDRTEIMNWGDGFMLGDVPVWLIDTQDPQTVEMHPRPVDSCFVLRCWRLWQGVITPYSVPVYPAFCGEVFVLYCDTRHVLLTKAGQPIPGIYYAGRDRRVCNRLTASQLIDWTKGTNP